MSSLTRPGRLALALPFIGLALGATVFLSSHWLGAYAYKTYCTGQLGCYDQHYVALMPGWVDQTITVLEFTSLGLVLSLSFAGILVSWREVSTGSQPGVGRDPVIAAAIISWLAFIAAFMTALIIPVFAAMQRGMHGRPLRLAGRATVGRVRRQRSAWSESIVPNVADISPAIRAQLAEEWLADARMEHSAIAAFSRLSCDLLAVGAPPELIEASSRAAADEVRHARACFALASAYAGEPLGPEALPEARSAARPRSRRGLLSALLHDSVIDGCIGERAAARNASESARQAVDPVVRRVLVTIAGEEAEHAVLADAIVDWVCTELGEESDEIMRRALLDAGGDVDAKIVSSELVCHGRLTAAALMTARAEALEAARGREINRIARTRAARRSQVSSSYEETSPPSSP